MTGEAEREGEKQEHAIREEGVAERGQSLAEFHDRKSLPINAGDVGGEQPAGDEKRDTGYQLGEIVSFGSGVDQKYEDREDDTRQEVDPRDRPSEAVVGDSPNGLRPWGTRLLVMRPVIGRNAPFRQGIRLDRRGSVGQG